MDKKLTYICDPKKNVNCPKSICQALGRGECIYTSDPKFALSPDMRIENNESFKKKQTNQDKLAEMVRTMDPKVLAKMIFEGHFEPIIHCENCPAKEYCDERMKYNENNPEFVTCEMVMNEWLVKEDTDV